jgi:hypothetical protein
MVKSAGKKRLDEAKLRGVTRESEGRQAREGGACERRLCCKTNSANEGGGSVGGPVSGAAQIWVEGEIRRAASKSSGHLRMVAHEKSGGFTPIWATGGKPYGFLQQSSWVQGA